MKNELSIPELIRHMNHDFMNKLQLIQMQLDLGKIEDSKQLIQEMSEHCKVISRINHLKIPKTITWLQTFSYVYPAIELTVDCDIKQPIPLKWDENISSYLQKTTGHVYEYLDPFSKHHLNIQIQSEDGNFQIFFDLKGNWDGPKFHTKEEKELMIDTYEQTNESWKYVIRSK